MGATLAARVLTLPPEYHATNSIASTGAWRLMYVPPDTAPDDPYVTIEVGTGGLNFPYGVEVVPDAPV